jgi:hypothetical protein
MEQHGDFVTSKKTSIPASQFHVGIAMKCGCTALGTISTNHAPPVVGCGLHNCTEIADPPPDLTGRVAYCTYGGNPRPSSFSLAFFKHEPNQPHDHYYCGCFGWD